MMMWRLTLANIKGTTLKTLIKSDRGYLEWIVSQDFNEDVKKAIQNALQGTFPERKAAAKVAT